MKKLLTIIGIGLLASNLTGQIDQLLQMTPIQKMIEQEGFNEDIEVFTLFERIESQGEEFFKEVSHFEVFQLKEGSIEEVLSEKSNLIKLSLIFQRQERILLLVKNEIFSNNYSLKNEKGEVLNSSPDRLFYKGIIKGENNSIATASFFEDEVRISFSDKRSNYRVTKLKDGNYIAYRDIDLLNTPDFNCAYQEIPSTDIYSRESDNSFIEPRILTSCQNVEIFFECDFAFYQAEGFSVNAVEQQVAAIFNEVQTIYFNESIPIAISEILVWTSNDPYASINSIDTVLSVFRDFRGNNYDGRLAHLLSTRFLNGGIAYRDVLCSTSLPYAVSSGIETIDVHSFPSYSWNVHVVAHELGHNFGSWHTQYCWWEGGPIDNCSIQEDLNGEPCASCCTPGPTPTNGGTIMSYCHSQPSIGVNFSKGFGPQPGNKIRSEFVDAECYMSCRTWVDYNWIGIETGYFIRPWNTLMEAVNVVPDGGIIYIKSSNGNETLTIDVNKSFIIRTWEGPSIIGQ